MRLDIQSRSWSRDRSTWVRAFCTPGSCSSRPKSASRFAATGTLHHRYEELRKLRRENTRLREARDILRKRPPSLPKNHLLNRNFSPIELDTTNRGWTGFTWRSFSARCSPIAPWLQVSSTDAIASSRIPFSIREKSHKRCSSNTKIRLHKFRVCETGTIASSF